MFGRTRRHAASDGAPVRDEAFVAQMQQAADDGFTGALDVAEHAFNGQASVYFFRGGLYSATIEGWEPRTVQRLVSSGALGESQSAVLASDHEAETRLVDSGVIPIDAVATIHQEMLLACVGSILRARLGRARRRQDAVTDVGCTLPLPVEDVVASVALRAGRMADTWRLVSSGATPAHAVLAQSVPVAQVPPSPPELSALHQQLDGHRTLDEAAWRCGFTRAEAVHLAASLVAGGWATVVLETASPSADRLLVPEAFGEAAPVGAAVVGDAVVGDAVVSDVSVIPASSPERARDLPAGPAPAVALAALEAELEQALRDQQAAADRVAEVRRRLDQAREQSTARMPDS